MINKTTIKIPAKYVPMLELVEHDSDGYWAYTNAGYYSPEMGCHTIHEDTQAALLAVIRGIEPCDCDLCLKNDL